MVQALVPLGRRTSAERRARSVAVAVGCDLPAVMLTEMAHATSIGPSGAAAASARGRSELRASGVHPEEFLAGVATRVFAEPRPPAGLRTVTSGVLGELRTRVLLSRCLDRSVAEAAASGWAGDRFVVAAEKAIDEKRLDGTKAIDNAALVAAGLLRRPKDGLRLLGEGDLKAKIAITVDHATASAKAAVEKAGGSVSVIEKKVLEDDVKKAAKTKAKRAKAAPRKAASEE